LDGYQAGAPFRTRLSPPDESQPRLIVSGHVYAADCLTPLAGALLEVWQANGEGRYDAAHFAARLVTDSEGRYEFSTVQPSPYFTSNQFFPAHIHYRVSYPAAPTVATQIFFEGDPLLKMQRISSAQRRLIRPIQLGRGPAGPVRRVTFDISLAIAPPG
jgi:protocatechuate 3,4-dioxygenase beta subunit